MRQFFTCLVLLVGIVGFPGFSILHKRFSLPKVEAQSTLDFTASNVKVTPASVLAGDKVTLTFKASNLTGPFPNGFFLRGILVLSNDTTLDLSDVFLGPVEIDFPNASSSVDVTVSNLMVPSLTTPGNKFIGVILDSTSSIQETNENNNTASTILTVLPPKPDLTISGLSFSRPLVPAGETVKATIQITNTGLGNAVASVCEIRFSDNDFISGEDPVLALVNTNAIPAKTSVTLTPELTIPPNTPDGKYFIGVMADAKLQVDEVDESNNSKTGTIQVGPIPDTTAPVVRVITPNGGETLQAGSNFDITWESSDNKGITSHEIRLSTDTGQTFSNTIATAVSGTSRSFTWSVPSVLTSQAQVQVQARDAAGNVGADASNSNFSIVAQGNADFSLSVTPATNQTITQGESGSFTIGVQPIAGFTQAVSLSAAIAPSSGLSTSFSQRTIAPGMTAMLTVLAAPDAAPTQYTITLMGVFGSSVRTRTLTIKIEESAKPDFTVQLSPLVQTVQPGTSINFAVGIEGKNGFSQPVQLNVANSTNGIQAALSETTLPPQSKTQMIVTIGNEVQPGTYPINVQGTSGSLSRAATATLTVNQPDPKNFSLTVSPATQTITPGMTTGFSLAVQAQGGFADKVTLSGFASPGDQNIVVTAVPGSVSPGEPSNIIVTTTPQTKPGTYALTLVGQSGAKTNLGNATLVVEASDFSLRLKQPELKVTSGQKGQIEVEIVRSGGFTGNVTVTPNGAQLKAAKLKVTPATVTTKGTTATFTYKVKTTGPAGRLQVAITGTDEQGRSRTGMLTVVIP